MLLDTVKTKQLSVECDGNSKTMGHPKVYLDLKKEGFIVCPYCSKRFEHESFVGTGTQDHSS